MIAVIPMKEHSERVPGKNIRDMCGRPLFAWIMESLFSARLIKRVIVNTDSQLIGGMVRDRFPQATVLYRPKHLRGDMVTGNALIDWTLGQVAGEHCLYTHATNPLLRHETIDRAIEAYHGARRGGNDSLFGATRHQFRLYRGDGQPVNHYPRTLERSQDLEPLYEDNSCLYLFSRDSFSRHGRIGARPLMFEVPKLEAIDIDTEDDWVLAEAVCSWLSDQ